MKSIYFLFLALSLFPVLINAGISQETHTVEQIFLHLDAVKGWNYTIPGPTIQIIRGDNIVFTFESHDLGTHSSVCYALGNCWEILWWSSPTSPNVFNFTLYGNSEGTFGTFAYFDGEHPSCSGQFSIRPDIGTFVTLYNSKANSTNWNSSADFDNNGIINLIDLVSLANLYSQRIEWIGPLPMQLEP